MAKLYFRYSAMNAGKSTYLLQVAHNYEEQGQSVRLFTASHYDENGRGVISSRLGLRREVDMFDAGFDFLAAVRAQAALVACLLVDEAQFLTPAQVRQLHRVAAEVGPPVICFGLRSDFRGEPFAGSAWLLALADDLEQIKTICACGRKATMNLRVDAEGRARTSGEQVGILKTQYRQVCARCFYRDTALEPPGA
ncbi:thymidine kinase [soil metagenome]